MFLRIHGAFRHPDVPAPHNPLAGVAHRQYGIGLLHVVGVDGEYQVFLGRVQVDVFEHEEPVAPYQDGIDGIYDAGVAYRAVQVIFKISALVSGTVLASVFYGVSIHQRQLVRSCRVYYITIRRGLENFGAVLIMGGKVVGIFRASFRGGVFQSLVAFISGMKCCFC